MASQAPGFVNRCVVQARFGRGDGRVFKIEQTAQHANQYSARAQVGSCRVPASRELPMPSFHVLKREADGSSIWVESVAELEKAKVRIRELASKSPGRSFFIFDSTSATVVTEFPRSEHSTEAA